MNEFVFLPDRGSDSQSSFDSLMQGIPGAARVAVSPQAAFPGNTGFTETSIAAANASIERADRSSAGLPAEVEIVDFVERTGAVLLKSPEIPDAGQLPSGQVVPVIYYQPAIADVRVGRSKLKLRSGPSAADFLKIELRFADDQSPVVGAVANLRTVGQPEYSAVSDANGSVTFGLRASSVTNARLMVEAGFAGHWGLMQQNASFDSGSVFEIERIVLSDTPDSLRFMMRPGNAADGVGVRVGVVDSGIGPHIDLPNAAGDADSSIGHGTHVAGIIGGRGDEGRGGVAPGVELQSYRVFSDPSTGVARNFEIHRAIEQAIEDDCLLVNLSLKSEFTIAPQRDDPVISRALEDAADAGVLCVAAAGNDFRRFVAFPARHADALAVSAVGWEPGLPSNAFDRWTVTDDRAQGRPDLFFANFSNEGVDDTTVDVTGPGAGVISTVPGDTYAPMSGTSMACPAIVGTIARLLSADGAVLNMASDRARTDRMLEIVRNNLAPLGFGEAREGGGTIS